MIEEWRTVGGFEGLYEVSNLGRVRSLDREFDVSHPRNPAYTMRVHLRGRVLKPKPAGANRQYRAVALSREGVVLYRNIHRLVAEAFIGPMPEGQETRHWNGECADNRASNLVYGTHMENMEDMVRHGRRVRGSQSVLAKITEADVKDILASSDTQGALAARFGISQSSVSLIKLRKTWRHVA